MKQTMAKKAQVYGLSSFLYALAIAIVLVIGLLGMSKEFSEKSQAAMYRFGSVETAKVAEITKKIMDQERGYAIDKSMFIAGAYGGYTSYKDFLKTTDCRISDKISGCGKCNTKNTTVAKYEWKCNQTTGWCQDINTSDGKIASTALMEFDCYGSISNSGGTSSCGIIDNVDISYLGEKKAAYWKAGSVNCVPSYDKIVSTVSDFAGNFFAKPDQVIVGALSAASMRPMYFNYLFKMGCYPGSADCPNYPEDTIETRWFHIGSARGISITYPPENPIVDYEFKPYVHLTSKTDFFKIYNRSKSYVDNEEFGSYLTERISDSLLPVVVDENFIVARGGGSVAERNCTTDVDGNPCSSGSRCGYPSIYCDYNNTSVPRPFQALVNFTMASYSNSTPLTCNADAATVSRFYDHDCKIYTTRGGDGKLTLDSLKGTDGFGGYCAGKTDTDSKAMRCVMMRTINNINVQMNLGNQNAALAPYNNSEFGWKYEFYNFTLTFKGTDKTNKGFIVYNKSSDQGKCGTDCIDANLTNPFRYVAGDMNLSGNASIGKINCSAKSVDVNYTIKVQPKFLIYSNYMAVYPVKFYMNYDGSGGNSYSKTEIMMIKGSSNSSTGTITSFLSNIAGLTKIKFSWSNLTAYPGDSNSDGGTSNISYCAENDSLNKTFKVSVSPPPCTKTHEGGYNCTTDSDCCSGYICGPNNTCTYCGNLSRACCANDWCKPGANTLCGQAAWCNPIMYYTYSCSPFGLCSWTSSCLYVTYLPSTPVCNHCGERGERPCDDEYSANSGCASGLKNYHVSGTSYCYCDASSSITSGTNVCYCGNYRQITCSTGAECDPGFENVSGICRNVTDICGNDRGRSTCSPYSGDCQSSTNNTWGEDPCCCKVYEHVFDLVSVYGWYQGKVRFNFTPSDTGTVSYKVDIYSANNTAGPWYYVNNWTGSLASSTTATKVEVGVTLLDARYVKLVSNNTKGTMSYGRIIDVTDFLLINGDMYCGMYFARYGGITTGCLGNWEPPFNPGGPRLG